MRTKPTDAEQMFEFLQTMPNVESVEKSKGDCFKWFPGRKIKFNVFNGFRIFYRIMHIQCLKVTIKHNLLPILKLFLILRFYRPPPPELWSGKILIICSRGVYFL